MSNITFKLIQRENIPSSSDADGMDEIFQMAGSRITENKIYGTLLLRFVGLLLPFPIFSFFICYSPFSLQSISHGRRGEKKLRGRLAQLTHRTKRGRQATIQGREPVRHIISLPNFDINKQRNIEGGTKHGAAGCLVFGSYNIWFSAASTKSSLWSGGIKGGRVKFSNL